MLFYSVLHKIGNPNEKALKAFQKEPVHETYPSILE